VTNKFQKISKEILELKAAITIDQPDLQVAVLIGKVQVNNEVPFKIVISLLS
jgi:hypothetical protein